MKSAAWASYQSAAELPDFDEEAEQEEHTRRQLVDDVSDIVGVHGEYALLDMGSVYHAPLPGKGNGITLFHGILACTVTLIIDRQPFLVMDTRSDGDTFDTFRPGRWMAWVSRMGATARTIRAARQQADERSKADQYWARHHAPVDDARLFPQDAD